MLELRLPDENNLANLPVRLKTSHLSVHIDGLAQDCSNSSVSAMKLKQFCADPKIFYKNYIWVIWNTNNQ